MTMLLDPACARPSPTPLTLRELLIEHELGLRSAERLLDAVEWKLFKTEPKRCAWSTYKAVFKAAIGEKLGFKQACRLAHDVTFRGL